MEKRRREKVRNQSLFDFIPDVSKNFVPPYHLRPFVEAIQNIRENPRKIVLSVPPRHAKTETVLHGIAYFLRKHPHLVTSFISYAEKFAYSKSRRGKMLAQRAGVPIAKDAKSLAEWRTTEGGGCIATGIGGPLTGHGVDLLIIDDPVKNRVEAESSSRRNLIWEWFNDVAYTRLEPGSSAIVIQTRWHKDDLAGMLGATGDWEVINLPAMDEDSGSSLWPERWTPDALADIRNQIGEYSWWSLYMGQPRPRGGALFDDVRFYDREPGKARYAIGIDFAYTSKTHSDYSTAVVMAEREGLLYIVDVVRLQVSSSAFAEKIKYLISQYPRATPYSIIGGTEIGILDLMAEQGIKVQYEVARGDKFTRAQMCSAAWNSGKILLPKTAPWLDTFITEVLEFTGVNDLHDDQVDALVAAHKVLSGSQVWTNLEFDTEQFTRISPWAI